MALMEMNWSPRRRQLCQFAVIALFALPLVGWLWGASPVVAAILAAVGLALGGLAFAFPFAIKPLFLLLSLIAMPIGIVIGEILLLLIYFGLFSAVALAFRLARRDALALRHDLSAHTYWTVKPLPQHVRSYYRQS
jgi:hypothetical protein